MQDIIFTESTTLAHPLAGKKIVFTGAITTMTRSEAAKRARLCGALMQGAVTKDTDFLILGDKRRGISTKQQKAMRLIQQGADIQILQENDFHWLLSI